MKKCYSFIVLLMLFFINAEAKPLHFNTTNSLFHHLTEVNKQWNFQNDLHNLNLETAVNFQNDNARIQTHLKLVHQVLSKRSTTHLDQKQRANRQRHLAVLATYFNNSIFPTNHYHTTRQPYFVDNFGVHCAVGYLLQQDGQTDVVATIRKNDNYAYIDELTKYSQLAIWAKANGFTLNELAWIQPGYGPPPHSFEGVGNGGGVDGEILCFEKSDDGEMLYIGGDFSTIDGHSSPSLAAWDGTDFHAIGGISGAVHDMEYFGDKLYVVGDFTMSQSQTVTNIAVWDGTIWTPLQSGDMNGIIHTIEIIWGRVYIGGDFQIVNNTPMSYLAYYDIFNSVWSNNGRVIMSDGSYTSIPNGFSVDAPVYDLEEIEGKLLVGGAFTQVAPNITAGNFNSFTTSYLAYWDYSRKWISGFNAQNDVVHAIGFLNGRLYLGSTIDGTNNALSVLTAGLWNYHSQFQSFDDNTIHNFFEFNGSVYAVGGLKHNPFIGTYGQGIIKISGQFGPAIQGMTFTSGSVKDAIEFKGKAYFGGDFDSLSNNYSGSYGITVNGFIVSELDGATDTKPIIEKENPFKVWAASNNVFIQSENINDNSSFSLYNINGQLIKQVDNINGQQHQIQVADLPRGVYVYQIMNNGTRQTGKLVF